MRRSSFCFVLALALQILPWVSAIPRTLPPNDVIGLSQNLKQFASKSKKEGEMNEEEAYYHGGRAKIGSSPPSCQHKCYGCNPCEAIQVPTTAGRSSRVTVQYTNYEPEGWKCKCGPTFYSP